MSGAVTLLVDQQGFFDDIYPTLLDPNSFAQFQTIRLPRGVGTARARARIDIVVEKHPALGAAFSRDPDGGWRQHMNSDRPPVKIIDIRGYGAREQRLIIEGIGSELLGLVRIDGPTAAFAIVQLAEDMVDVVFAFHHLVCDSFSIEVLCRELRSNLPAGVDSDRYVEYVDAIRELSCSCGVWEALSSWTRLPWDSFSRVPSRLLTDASGATHTRSGLVVPDIWASELSVPDSISSKILETGEKRTQVLGLLRPAVCETFGAVVPAAYVEGGRSFRAPAEWTDWPSMGITIGAVGWFALTGLVLLSQEDVPTPAPFTWGLLQRISAREPIGRLLARMGQPPSVWINVVSRSGEAPKCEVTDVRRLDTDAVPMGAARSVTFVGMPLAFHVTLYRNGVTVGITWDAGVFTCGEIAELKQNWNRHYSAE